MPDAATAAPVTWPSVTAVVPTRERPELLARAVTAILDQDYPGDLEAVVVFDQSPVRPVNARLPAGRRLRSVVNDHTPGLAGARNSGIAASSADLVAFCDDDDEWLPGKLRAQIVALRNTPDAAAVASGILVHYRGRDRARPAPAGPLQHRDFLADRIMEVHPSTLLVPRRLVLDEIGPVDEAIPGGYAEDYEFLLRATRTGPVVAVPEPLVRVHWHATSFFFDRWRTIVAALNYLIEKHPEFRDEPRGLARLQGQLAFAHAGLGEGAQARALARAALRSNWREKRALLAILISTGAVKASAVTRLAHRFGRGV